MSLLHLQCVQIFFLLIPRPPRSTLFPYTTLFRSAKGLEVVDVSGKRFLDFGQSIVILGHAHPDIARAVAKCIPEDRKSTRLNSSHTVISYAVFCLKKKKQISTRQRLK